MRHGRVAFLFSKWIIVGDYMKKIATILLAGTMVLGMGTVMPEEIVNDTAIYASAASSKTSIKNAAVSGIKNKYYSGKAKKQTLTVKLGSKTLTEGTDYTISYKNNKAIGKATVTIKGKGKYTGTITKTFKICPKKTTLKTASSPASGKLKVTYAKQTNITAYQITYSTDKNFKTNVASKSSAKLTKTISDLKQGKTYYVKVRTYKTVNDVRYYSGYSEVKKVKIKTAPPTKPIGKGYETYFLADTDFDGDKELVEVYDESIDEMQVRRFRIYESKSKYTDKTISYPSYQFGGMALALIKDKNINKTYAVALGSHQYTGFGIRDNYDFSQPDILGAYLNYISGKYSGKLVKGVDYEIVHKLNGKVISKKKYKEYFKNLEVLYIYTTYSEDLINWGYNYDNRVDEIMDRMY